MKETFKNIKAYYALSGVKWQFVLLEFVVLLLPSLLSILSPILTASVISSITVFDFHRARVLLGLDFGIILLTAALYFVYHIFSSRLQKEILLSASELVYEKVRANPAIDHITLATTEDIWNFSKFNSSLLYKLCFFIKSVIILGIIFSYKPMLAMLLILVSIISAALLSLTNRQIQRRTLELSKAKANSLDLFNSIQRGADIEGNKYMEGTMRYRYFDSVIGLANTNNKITLFYNLNNNFISLILKFAVFLSTFYLITRIESTALTLPVFLVLTPYLTSSAQNLIAFFEIFPEIGIVENTLREFDKLSAPPEPAQGKSTEDFSIEFIHAALSDDYCTATDLNFKIEEREVVEIIGGKQCGKRAIANLLTKKSLPTAGTILIGNKNIFELSNEAFSKLTFITYKSPYFYDLTIMENLLILCGKKSKVNEAISTLGLSDMIAELKSGQDTPLSDKTSPNLLFFLGLARAYLSKAKILLIYEIPSNLSEDETELLKNIISTLSATSTVILFLHAPLLENSRKLFLSGGPLAPDPHSSTNNPPQY